MDICDIIFCSENDEARAIIWAALIGVAGALAALIAAYIVGRRQIEIVGRQVEIADQALRLEVLKVRVEVFDKRVSVYERTRYFLEFWSMHDRIAGYAKERGDKVPVEEMRVRRDFILAMHESQFLFRPSVHERLRDMFAVAKKLHQSQRKMELPLGAPGREEAFENAEKLSEKLQEVQLNLPRLFGDEMNLSDAAVMDERLPTKQS